MLIKKFPGITAENIFFYISLLATVGILVFCGSFPSLDGPSHIYNAQITNYLLSGNKFMREYYAISKGPSPNYTDHYLLVILLKFFSFSAAGKILQIAYVIFFVVLFRRLVYVFNPAGIGMSILSIPFAFTILYYMGFYNFCLSFPMLFFIILYYQKHFANVTRPPITSKYFILGLLILLLYFTNGLAFLFSGLVLGLFELRTVWRITKEKKNIFKRVLLFVAIWLPGVVLFTVFMLNTPSSTTDINNTFSELFSWLVHGRILMVYTGFEFMYTDWLVYMIALGLIAVLIFKIRSKTLFVFSDALIFLIAFLVSIGLFFIVPDGVSVGMMSLRLCVFVFVFFLLWLSMQTNFKVVTWIIAVAGISMHFMLLINMHMPAESGLDEKSELIKATGDYIQPNSVVLDINVTDNWLFGHFGDYLTIGKPLVMIPNYEATNSWFAIRWNDEMPQIIYNGQDSIAGLFGLPGPDGTKNRKEIDYVFIHGDFSKIQKEQKWEAVKEGLLQRYIPAYTSSDSSVHLYQLKGMSTSLLPN